MTAPSSTRRAGPFSGNGVTIAFPFTFKVFSTADIAIYITDAAGAQTLLSSNFSVTLNGDQDASPGGTINYPTVGSPLANGYSMDVVGDLAYTQGTDLTNLGRFQPNVVERALDKLTILAQQLKEKLARAITFPVGDTASTTLPVASERAGKTLTFDDDGNVIVDDSVALAAASAAAAAASQASASTSAATATTKAATATAAASTAVAVSAAAASAVLYGGAEQVVGAGDSIMWGLTAPNTITILTAMAAYYKPLSLATYTNDGVAGSKLDSTITGGGASGSDMVVRYAAQVYPKRPAASGSVRSLLIIDIGANDYQIMTAAQATTWITRFETYCATARTDGFRVVAFTIMPRTGAGNTTELAEDNRKRMNDAIRRSLNVDAYVDAAQLFTDTSGANFIDGTHPNDTGNTILGRAATSSVASIGKPIATAALPASTGDPTVTPAMAAVLDAACVEGSATSANLIQSLAASVPAIGAGDYTVEGWWWQPAGQNSVQPFIDSTTSSFGNAGAVGGYVSLYVLPGVAANWSTPRAHGGFWNHGLISRTGGTATFYLNGVNIGTAADANVHAALTRIYWPSNSRLARVRVYSRALSAAEALASYNNLSEFNAGEASYVFALEDGCRSAGQYLEDLSSSKAHLLLTDTTRVRIKRPANRCVLKRQTVGNTVVGSVAAGYRVVAWTADVTVSGGGNVNLGDTNGGGEYMPNTVLTTGKKVITVVTPFTVSGTIYVNAAGYTINHTILLEKL